MSFWTSLICYRPTSPPVVTGADLAGFVREFGRLGLGADPIVLTAKVKFGKHIDANPRPSLWQVFTQPSISVAQEIDWDIREEPKSLAGMCDLLAPHERPIYRAHLGLGAPPSELSAAVSRPEPVGDEAFMWLDTWGLDLGPVELYHPMLERTFKVGWMRLSLGGQGYPFPWTNAEVYRRVEACPGLQQAAALCRRTWPVKPTAPPASERKMRERMEDLWSGERLDRPMDWCWGLNQNF